MSRSRQLLTFSATKLTIVNLTVHVVTLAKRTIDLLFGCFIGVANTLPTHTVAQARAGDGGIVLAATLLQFLAGFASSLTIAILSNKARKTADMRE